MNSLHRIGSDRYKSASESGQVVRKLVAVASIGLIREQPEAAALQLDFVEH